MMEPLSHYHCEIYRCIPVPINLNHASTCTSTCTINKCINHAPTYTKQPVINLYHKKVHPTMHQLCTNNVCQLLINYDSSICTNHHQLYTSCMCQLINYLSQLCTQHVPQPKALIHFIIEILFVSL
jgi:hypothetical protein